MDPYAPLLFDLGPLSCGCTDHTLEEMHKALGDPPGEDIWLPHHDHYVRDHIEDVTQRGLGILDSILSALLSLFGLELRKADSWRRWTPEELDAVMHDLGGKDPKDYTLPDWLKVVDWLLQRYLPGSVIQTEAEYLAVRGYFAGRIQVNIEGHGPTEAAKVMLAGAAPIARRVADHIATLTARESAVLDFSIMRAGELIADIGDATRHRIRQIIIEHEEGRVMNRPDASMWDLQSRLQDEFAVLNRDWRRVALSEVARDANEGFLASLPDGARVKRVEAYNACPFCKKIDGLVMNVVSPSKDEKDGWTEVWVGKTNVGRSASPRKRIGSELVEREEEERYWPAAGIQHPNCRGTWSLMPKAHPGADPKFIAWMEDALAGINRQPVNVEADNLRTDAEGHKYFTRPGGTMQKAIPVHSGEALTVASELVGAVREILGAIQPVAKSEAPTQAETDRMLLAAGLEPGLEYVRETYGEHWSKPNKPAPVDAEGLAKAIADVPAPNITVHAPITVQMPEQPATVIHVAAPEVTVPITVQSAAVTVPAPIINLPEMVVNVDAPVVNVEAPVVHVAAPEVSVPVNVQPADITIQPAPVTVSHPARSVQTVRRDKSGEILSTETTYESK